MISEPGISIYTAKDLLSTAKWVTKGRGKFISYELRILANSNLHLRVYYRTKATETEPATINWTTVAI